MAWIESNLLAARNSYLHSARCLSSALCVVAMGTSWYCRNLTAVGDACGGRKVLCSAHFTLVV